MNAVSVKRMFVDSSGLVAIPLSQLVGFSATVFEGSCNQGLFEMRLERKLLPQLWDAPVFVLKQYIWE